MVHFLCAYCGETVNTRLHSSHFRNKHPSQIHDQYKCGICSQISTDIRTFTNHVKSHGPIHEHSLPSSSKQENQEATGTQSSQDENQSRVFDENTKLLDFILKFLLFLHCQKISRKTVRAIADQVFTSLIPAILEISKSRTGQHNSGTEADILYYVNWCYKEFKTEHKLLKELERKGLYFPPKKVTLSSQFDSVHVKGKIQNKTKTRFATLIDMGKVFCKVFEIPQTYHRILHHIKILKESPVLKNFMQTEFWQNKIKNITADLVLPIFLFFDDFGADNPVGPKTKAHCIGGCYLKLPFLPPEIEAKLDNIFSVYLIESVDKQLGNDQIFNPLVEQLKQLEETGVTIDVEGKKMNIKFVVGLIVGDNLGLNEILGYTKCFTANFQCRICKIQVDKMREASVDDPALWRNESTYQQYVETQNVSLTGIHESCVFNKIPSFQVWENKSIDLMHDVFEGVAHYDLGAVLNYGLNKKLFTLEDLNLQKNTLNYGPFHIGNLASDIKKEHIQKKRFKMTASEMATFLMCLPLIIGSYFSESCKVWQFFLCLLKIIDVLLEPEVTDANTLHLKNLIRTHHKFYTDNFGRLTLKFHNMVHYDSIMRLYGPVHKFSSIRLEAKHKPHKDYARISFNRKNLPWSLAVNEQIHLSHRFFCEQSFNWNSPEFGPLIPMSRVKDELPSDLEGWPVNAKFYKWIRVNGIKYEPNHLLNLDHKENLPQMSSATHFYSADDQIFAIVRDNIETTRFSQHYHCFVANYLSQFTIRIVNINSVLSFPCTMTRIPRSSIDVFIIKRQF
jgi:hypothetical protein